MSTMRVIILLVFVFNTAYSSVYSKYNESCTPSPNISNDGCNPNSYNGIHCHPELHVCRCVNETTMIYNEEKEQCIVQGFGTNCMEEWDSMFSCEEENGMVCDWHKGTCQCSNSHLPAVQNPSSETKCLPAGPNVPCSDSMPCHESTGLLCTNGMCQCPHPLSQSYHANLGCLGLPEAFNGCDPELARPIPQCVDNSVCGEDRKCHCKQGYSQGFKNRQYCRLDYGQVCNISSDNCNSDHGFYCMDGRCECKNVPDVRYDVEQNVCAATQGFACNLVYELGYYLPCLTGLKCKSDLNNPFFGTCEKTEKSEDEGEVGDGNGNQTGKESVLLIFKMFK